MIGNLMDNNGQKLELDKTVFEPCPKAMDETSNNLFA